MQYTAKAWKPGTFAGSVALYRDGQQLGTWCGWGGNDAELPAWFAKFGVQIIGQPTQGVDDYGYAYALYQLAKTARS